MKGEKWYDDVYSESKNYRLHPSESPYFDLWMNAIRLIKNERILDFGCGSGQFAKLLLMYKKRFIRGYDFSKEALAIAKEMNPWNKDQFYHANLLNLKKLPSYDLVTSFEVLEHIDKDIDVLKKVSKGKRIIFSVPDYDYISHVRFFPNSDEVIKRYSTVVEFKQILIIPIYNKKNIFLCDTVKL